MDVVLIEGNDLLYADGGADFLGNLRLFVRCEDTHDVGYVVIGNDFDACLGCWGNAQ